MTQPSLFDDDDPKRNVRRDDPETSREAANAHVMGRKTQKWRMLQAHVRAFRANPGYTGMNADEAWIAAGGSVPSVSCYWKRHSELERLHGFLVTVRDEFGQLLKRPGVSGDDQEVRRLTDEGLEYYNKIVAARGE